MDELFYDPRDYPPDDPFWEEPTEPVIVRCKDCKYGEQCVPPDEDRYCVLYDQRHDMNWFCADGEVKQDDQS